MVEMIVLIVVLGVAGLGVLVGGGMYLADPTGWKLTVKRLAKITRASIESGKTAKVIESKSVSKDLEADWDRQFKGKELEAAPKVFEHKIVETWFGKRYGISEELPHFKCSCGYSNWHVNITATNMMAKEHVKNSNRAEKAKVSGSKLQW